MKKQNKRQIGSLLFLLFCLLFNTQISFASEMPKLIHFTISYEDKGQKIQGAKFSIYKIGDVGEYNKVILNGDFKDYPVDIRSINRDEWNEYANTLKAYAKKDNVKATFEGTTDKNGIISAKLKKGLYLVVGQDLIRNGYRYKTNPFIVYLPKFDKNTDQSIYTVVSYPKLRKEEIPSPKVSVSVLKVWEDKGFEEKRPKYIEVELLENGRVKNTVKLNKENNWQHRWENLTSNATWSVIEKNTVKNIYKVKIREDKSGYVITNSYVPTQEPPINPPRKIPQTGQLWWPVYLLSSIGILSIIIGYAKEVKKGENYEKENIQTH